MKRILIIIFLISSLCLNAQTRFYLNLFRPAPVAPAFNAGWNVTTGAVSFLMSTTKDASTIASKTSAQVGAAAVRKTLIDQWVSDELAAQTITGTFTGQVRMNLNSTSSTTGQGFLYLRIINRDGSVATEVGTCTTTDLTTTLTNRTLISLNVGTLSIQAGQRICIELGWNMSVGVTTTRTGTASRGSSSANDLIVNNTTTTANNPWVEFSQTLVFYNPATSSLFSLWFGVSPPSITYATLNSLDRGINVALSNGNLTATRSGGAGMVRATIGISSPRKVYWEMTVNTVGNQTVGIANINASVGNYLSSDVNGLGMFLDDGSNNCTTPLGAFANTNVIGFALDMNAGTLTIYKNNISLGVMCSGLTGTYYPAWGCEAQAVVGTFNFGATSMTYPAPAGYTQGVYN